MQYFDTNGPMKVDSATPSHMPIATAQGDEGYGQDEPKNLYLWPDIDQSTFTLQMLLRQTGFGIKVRFLFALTLIAIFPAIILVILLGDPFGQELRATVSQSLTTQAQAQAGAIEQAITTRRFAVSHLAERLAQLGGPLAP